MFIVLQADALLGHVNLAVCVSPDFGKLRGLADWPKPTTVREM